MEDIFKLYKINIKKLEKYGFKLIDDKYFFSTKLLDDQFEMIVCFDKNGNMSTKLVDHATNEEYFLHLVEGTTGEFVGKVREEHAKVLEDIRNNCFDKEIFKGKQTKKIISLVKEDFDCDAEYLWEKFPENAIWRRKDNKKWFGLIMTIHKNKLGLEGTEKVEVLNVKAREEKIENIIDNENIFRAYHMNKKSWITIVLNEKMETKQIMEFIKESFELVKTK